MGRARKNTTEDDKNRQAIHSRNYRARKKNTATALPSASAIAPPLLPPILLPPPPSESSPELPSPLFPSSPISSKDYQVNARASPIRAVTEHPFFNNPFFDVAPGVDQPKISNTETSSSRIPSLEPQFEEFHINHVHSNPSNVKGLFLPALKGINC